LPPQTSSFRSCVQFSRHFASGLLLELVIAFMVTSWVVHGLMAVRSLVGLVSVIQVLVLVA
jgi:hypothetical protein